MRQPATTPLPSFTPSERHTLCALRRRYRRTCDLFSEQELARLLFMRWLTQSRCAEQPESAERLWRPSDGGGLMR